MLESVEASARVDSERHCFIGGGGIAKRPSIRNESRGGCPPSRGDSSKLGTEGDTAYAPDQCNAVVQCKCLLNCEPEADPEMPLVVGVVSNGVVLAEQRRGQHGGVFVCVKAQRARMS